MIMVATLCSSDKWQVWGRSQLSVKSLPHLERKRKTPYPVYAFPAPHLFAYPGGNVEIK